MAHDYEKTYSLTFSDEKSASKALNLMQDAYRSKLYECFQKAVCTPKEYVVIFPEGGKSLLSEELQQQAVECDYPPRGDYFLPVVFRFMEECYIDQFLESGTIQISTFKHCSRLEDSTRLDKKEGRSTILGVKGTYTMKSEMKMGDDVFILCTSLSSRYIKPDGSNSNTALEIYNLGGFVDACYEALKQSGYHILNVTLGPCFYSEKTVYGALSDDDINKLSDSKNLTLDDIFRIPSNIAGPKMYFQKPLEKAVEQEFRIIWHVYPEPQENTLIIKIDNPTKYARKVKSE